MQLLGRHLHLVLPQSQLLDPITDPVRITHGQNDSVYPKLSFGPDGNVGILFRDDRLGPQHVFFTRLGCVVGNDGVP